MALRGAERWEIELAIEASLDRHHEIGCPIARAVDAVCDMHGILDESERRIVRDVAELRLTLQNAAAVAA